MAIKLPFIAEMDTGFVVVTGFSGDKVIYKDSNSVDISLHKIDFISRWTGIVSEFLKNDNAIEPSYVKNLRNEQYELCLRFLVVICLLIILGGGLLFRMNSLDDKGLLVLVALNCWGLAGSFLLLKKYLHIESRIANQFCSIFKNGDCSNIEKYDIKFMGIWDLSEIGVVYFFVNIFALIAFPKFSFQILSVFSVVALLFTVWSLIYQKIKLKKWCPLCLLVVFILWAQFITCLMADIFHEIRFDLSLLRNGVIMISAYVIILFFLNKYVLLFAEMQNVRKESRALLNLKYNRVYWEMLLHSQKYYALDKVLTLVVNDENSRLPQITVVGNPYCNPCARMHSRLDLLKKRNFNIQYIFTVFNPKHIDVIRHIIAAYYVNRGCFWDLLTNWYTVGRFSNFNIFFSRQIKDVNDSNIEEFIRSQKNWIDAYEINETPMILINGYKMPIEYQIEDLLYLY